VKKCCIRRNKGEELTSEITTNFPVELKCSSADPSDNPRNYNVNRKSCTFPAAIDFRCIERINKENNSSCSEVSTLVIVWLFFID
jgi:hypothetical protein